MEEGNLVGVINGPFNFCYFCVSQECWPIWISQVCLVWMLVNAIRWDRCDWCGFYGCELTALPFCLGGEVGSNHEVRQRPRLRSGWWPQPPKVCSLSRVVAVRLLWLVNVSVPPMSLQFGKATAKSWQAAAASSLPLFKILSLSTVHSPSQFSRKKETLNFAFLSIVQSKF